MPLNGALEVLHIFDARNPYSVIFVLGISIILLFGAWFIGVTSANANFVEEQKTLILSNQSKWNESKPKNYSYSIWYGCMLSDTTNVIVKNGVINLATDKSGLAIENLFDIALKVVSKAYSYKFEYNKNYGFISHIKVDWNKDNYDDECFYEIQRFSVSE